jgi:tripartite-type tricarboxylate transporter receptor subunit TctC
MQRRTFCSAAALAALSSPSHDARAAGFPEKTITLVYNFSPGGPGDAIARYLAQQIGVTLGQQVIVDNRTGGNGVVGILAAARAPADGYTLLYTPVTGVVQLPLVTKDASFSATGSLVPVLHVGKAPLVLYAHPSVPANDMPGWITWARTQPDGVDVAGAGPIIEVATALLSEQAKIKLVYVPFRGAAPALQATLGGDVKTFLCPPSSATAQNVAVGKLKALGVTTAEPSPLLPGVAPIALTVPNYVQEINFVLWAPRGVPADVLARLRDAALKALQAPDVEKRFRDQGLVVQPGSAAEVLRIVEREDRTIRRAVEKHGIKFS